LDERERERERERVTKAGVMKVFIICATAVR
jgi:hypothetical protein